MGVSSVIARTGETPVTPGFAKSAVGASPWIKSF
jgi:hypothetical protein